MGRWPVRWFVALASVALPACQALLRVDADATDVRDAATSPSDASLDSSDDVAHADVAAAPGATELLVQGQSGAAQIAVSPRGVFWVDEPLHAIRGYCPTGGKFICGQDGAVDLGSFTPSGNDPRSLIAVDQYLLYFRLPDDISILETSPVSFKKAFTAVDTSELIDLAGTGGSEFISGAIINGGAAGINAIRKYPAVGGSQTTMIYDGMTGPMRAVAVADPNIAFISKAGVMVGSLDVELAPLVNWATEANATLIEGVREGLFAFATDDNAIKLASKPVDDGGTKPGELVFQEQHAVIALTALKNESATWLAWITRDPRRVSLIRIPSEGQTPIRIESEGEPRSVRMFGDHVYWTTADRVFRAGLPK